MFENREIDGWFVKSERLQGKKHRNTCCIPRIFDAAAAAFCRKRRLFRFFKQPLDFKQALRGCWKKRNHVFLRMQKKLRGRGDIPLGPAAIQIANERFDTKQIPTGWSLYLLDNRQDHRAALGAAVKIGGKGVAHL